MRDDLARPGTAGDDQITQLGVVALVMVTAHAHGDSFPEQRLPRDGQVSTSFDLPDRLRIVGEEHTDDAEVHSG